MGYWRKVAKRAWQDAREGVGLGTAERMIALIFVQAMIALLIYIGLGETALHDALPTRMATAAAPFLLLPVLFAFRFFLTPPRIDKEWEDWKAEHAKEQNRERWGLMYQISNLYRREVEDNPLILEGLAWPPVEYLNEKLAEYGETWRVVSTRGPNFVLEDI